MTAKEIQIRNAEPADHARILSVMPNWWNGRDLTALLPDLFLVHFTDTCFIMEQGTELIGFLVGLLSQSHPKEAYIHFVGVHPDHRKAGIGTTLYERFFEICRKHGRSIVHARTSLVNTGSIGFHKRMGFQVEYGESKALFVKSLE